MNRFDPTSLRPEAQLLLLCARVDMSPAQQQAAQTLARDGVDWESVVSDALRQGVATILYHHLQRMDVRDTVEAQPWNALEQVVHKTRLLTMRQQFHCGVLLDALQVAGVEAIALKGLALRESVYRDPLLRPSGDIDLLVEQEAAVLVERILQDLGYVADESYQPRSLYRPDIFHELVPYCLPKHQVQVDVHWQLAPPECGFRIDVKPLWNRSTIGSVAGRPMHLLAPEDLLLHLCLHTSRLHQFLTGLRHLVDVAETMHQYGGQLDWDQLAVRAVQWGVHRYLYLTLRVTDDLLGIGAWKDSVENLRPVEFDEALVSAARLRVLGLAHRERQAVLTENLAGFLLAKSPGEKLRALASTLFPSRQRMAYRYSLPPESVRVFGWYVVRPIELVVRHSGLLAGIILGSKRFGTEDALLGAMAANDAERPGARPIDTGM